MVGVVWLGSMWRMYNADETIKLERGVPLVWHLDRDVIVIAYVGRK